MVHCICCHCIHVVLIIIIIKIMGFSHTFFSVDPLDNLEFWMHFHYLRLHVQIKYRCAYVSD